MSNYFDHLLNFGSVIILFGMVEARHIKFGVHIDLNEYWRMRDGLLPKGLCSGSSDFFKF